MKNTTNLSAPATLVAVFFFFFNFNLFSQDKREPIKPYGDYSLQQVISFALDSTSDAKEFRVALLSVLEPALQDTFQKLGKTFSEAYLKVILERCQSEEVSFKPGEWENSGRNKKNRRIEFFPGGDWEGFAWVFHWGSIRVPLVKQSCMNIIKVKNGAQKSAPAKILPEDKKDTTSTATEEPMVWVQLWYVRYLFGGAQNVGTFKAYPPVFKQVPASFMFRGVPPPTFGGGDYPFYRAADPDDLDVFLKKK